MSAGPAATSPRYVDVACIGDPGAGKTSFFWRFVHGTFNHVASSIIGIEFGMKRIDELDVTVRLWDNMSAGDRFRPDYSYLYRKKNVLLLFADPERRDAVDNISCWMRCAQDYYVDRPDVLWAVVWTKSDIRSPSLVANLEEEFTNTVALDKALARRAKQLLFFNTSSKHGTGIDECIREVVAYAACGANRVTGATKLPSLTEVVPTKKGSACGEWRWYCACS